MEIPGVGVRKLGWALDGRGKSGGARVIYLVKRRLKMKENKEFNSIMAGLTESLEYAKGNTSKARKVSISIAELPTFHDKEIKKIREDLNLSQKNFAFVLGVSPKTVEAWESGRNIPQGTAQRFLQILQFGGKKMLQDFHVLSINKSYIK